MRKPAIVQISFFWKNNEPGGLGFSFCAPSFSPEDIQEMFYGEIAQQYMRDSDNALGSMIVESYLAQLKALGQAKMQGKEPTLRQAILAGLNILWLTQRGFMPNDEYNSMQTIRSVQ